MSFYVLLPSNRSLNVFTGNHSSSYTNHLPRRLEFHESDWEVGLASISLSDSQVYTDSTKLGILILEERYDRSRPRVTANELLQGRPITDGVSMVNKLIDMIQFQYFYLLRSNVHMEDANGLRQQWLFHWVQRGNERVLMMAASEIDHNFESENKHYLPFNITFAKNFKMIKEINADLISPDEKIKEKKLLNIIIQMVMAWNIFWNWIMD